MCSDSYDVLYCKVGATSRRPKNNRLSPSNASKVLYLYYSSHFKTKSRTKPFSFFWLPLLSVLLAACTESTIESKLKTARWVEPRLSVDQTNEPCLVSDKPESQCARTLKELRAASYQRTTLSDHQLGLLHMVVHQDSSRAIERLQLALRNDDDNAAIWSDLAAANILSLSGEGGWRAQEQALDAANRAIAEDGAYSRAYFNRALALESAHLHEAALFSWSATKTLSDFDDPWLLESERRHGALSRSLQSSSAAIDDGTLLSLTQTQIESLSDLQLDNSNRFIIQTGSLLTSALTPTGLSCPSAQWSQLGSQVKERFGDSLLLDTTNWICAANTLGDRSSVELTTGAILAYKNYDYSGALELLETFAKETNTGPLANVALSVQAATLFALGRPGESSALLRKAAKEHDGVDAFDPRYPFLAARNHEMLGSMSLRATDNETAQHHYQQGLERLVRGGDAMLKTRLMVFLAESLARAHQFDQAWLVGQTAISDLRQFRIQGRILATACGAMALIAEASGAVNLQLQYARCFNKHLQKSDGPRLNATALLALARAQAVNRIDASQVIERSTMLIDKHTLGPELKAHLDYAAGLDLITKKPDVALGLLAEAESSFAEQDNQEYQIISATASMDLGGESSKLIELATQALGNTRSANFSLSVQRRYRAVYERRVRELLDNQQSNAAMLLLQQSRRVESADHSYFDLITSAHEPGQGTLVLAALGSVIAGWLIDETGVRADFKLQVDAEVLVEAIMTSANFSAPMNERLRALSYLRRTLIEPIDAHLAAYSRLRVVPDGVLFGVAFPLLWDEERREFLIESVPLTVAPELRPGQVRTKRPINSVALFSAAMGNPDRPLYFADKETERLAELLNERYDVSHFQKDAASADQFKALLRRADVVHYAGHGESNVNAPRQARLIFGPAAEEQVSVDDINGLTLLQAPSLVTLAACDTAAYSDRLPNALALVRPLLDNGVDQVVGSLKPISDRLYSQFMQAFYAAFLETEDATLALQMAQVHVAKELRTGQPLEWGFIQLFEYL